MSAGSQADINVTNNEYKCDECLVITIPLQEESADLILSSSISLMQAKITVSDQKNA